MDGYGYTSYDDSSYGDVMYQSAQTFTVDDCREDLERIKNYFQNKDYHENAMTAFFTNWRKMPDGVAEDADAFFIDEDIAVTDLPEWMRAQPYGLVKRNTITMSGRCCLPVKTAKGKIAGFLGWDPTTTPKYLDSSNYGYKATTTLMYGMENIEEYYFNNKPVFLTEGSMCVLWLRSQGFQALSSLGSTLTPYMVEVLSRFGNRLYAVPDNDAAGFAFKKSIKYKLPLANIIMVKEGKDIDGCRGEHSDELLEDLNNITNLLYRPKILIR